MNRHLISIPLALTVLIGAHGALAQDGERAGREESQFERRERLRNMSETEREKIRSEMRDVRERWQNMSEADKEKFRARMRERFDARPPFVGREEQLKAIETIEEQLAKLKASMEITSPGDRSQYRTLSEEERAALRKKIGTAMRDRQTTIRSIESELAKLKGPRRLEADPQGRISELRAIHKLAVKENATETAERLEKLIASYRRESQPRGPRPELRPRSDAQRVRPDRPPREDSSRRARSFTLTSFDGKTVNLADYRGKTVVLEWLNFECPFSKYHYETTTTMADLAKKYKDQNVVWLAINSTSHTTPEANKAFTARHKLQPPRRIKPLPPGTSCRFRSSMTGRARSAGLTAPKRRRTYSS